MPIKSIVGRKHLKNVYRKAVNCFIEFRVKWDLSNVWPVENMDIVAFISHMNIEGFAPSTISTYISALSFVHKVNAWAHPPSSFIVTKVKEGCRRGRCQGDSRHISNFGPTGGYFASNLHFIL